MKMMEEAGPEHPEKAPSWANPGWLAEGGTRCQKVDLGCCEIDDGGVRMGFKAATNPFF